MEELQTQTDATVSAVNDEANRDELLKKQINDWQNKFSASSREALAIRADNQKLLQELESYRSSDNVEELLRKQYPSYDIMDEPIKIALKETASLKYKLERREEIDRKKQELAEKEKAKESIFADYSIKYPDLAQKKDEFLAFIDRHPGETEIVAKAFVADLVPSTKQGYNTSIGTSTAPQESKKQKSEFEKTKDFYNNIPVKGIGVGTNAYGNK